MTVHWETSDWETRRQHTGNDKVYYLCHKKQEKEVKSRIAGWAMDKNLSGNTKCSVQLSESFHDKCCLGWIELNNGFFFFIDKDMYNNVSNFLGIK